MRRAFGCPVLLATFCCAAPACAGDELGHVEAVMRKWDASLTLFRIEGRKNLSDTESVLLVGASRKPRGPLAAGVFLVSGPANRVRLVIDLFWPKASEPFPTLVGASTHTVYLDKYSDYGLYFGSIKYFFDAASRQRPVKRPYRKLEIIGEEKRGGRLVYYVVGGLDEADRDGKPLAGLTYRKLTL
jgi:hypothetical protein